MQETITREVHRGQVYWCATTEMGEDGNLYKGKHRPVIIVSNETGNSTSQWVNIVPITSQPKKPMKTHVEIEVGKIKGTAICEKIESVSKDYLTFYCATLSDDTIEKINAALIIQLDLPVGQIVVGGDQDLRVALVERERDTYKSMYDNLISILARNKSNEQI